MTKHYGWKKSKSAFSNSLAVRQLVKNPKGSILCFVGPPSVGKTSLAMSIGHANGRQILSRPLLGGVRDEAESAVIAAPMISARSPGQNHPDDEESRHCKSNFVLDESTKCPRTSAAIPTPRVPDGSSRPRAESRLQPIIISTVEYDLSKVMFVCNRQRSATHPQAAAGPHGNPASARYTEQEKLEIAKRFLVSARARSLTGPQPTKIYPHFDRRRLVLHCIRSINSA